MLSFKEMRAILHNTYMQHWAKIDELQPKYLFEMTNKFLPNYDT